MLTSQNRAVYTKYKLLSKLINKEL